jgi:hypothetical protein
MKLENLNLVELSAQEKIITTGGGWMSWWINWGTPGFYWDPTYYDKKNPNNWA